VEEAMMGNRQLAPRNNGIMFMVSASRKNVQLFEQFRNENQ
jgi:hypothetical protein